MLSSRKKNSILLVLLYIVASIFAGCSSKDSNIILLDKPDPITYPEYYEQAIEEFPSYLTVDPISDYMDAAQKGQQLWQQSLKELADEFLERAVEVFYVPEDDTWVVQGTLPEDFVGMLPISIIKSDGTVLSVGWI